MSSAKQILALKQYKDEKSEDNNNANHHLNYTQAQNLSNL